MNLLIKLDEPDDYRQDQGARFVATFDKCRGAYPQPSRRSRRSSPQTAGTSNTNVGFRGRTTSRIPATGRRGDDRPKSASAAIKAARIQKAEGLKVWADLLKRGEIVRGPEGFGVLGE